MIRHALALLLALALPASAQQFGVGGQVVSGGVTQQWFGYGKPNGTSGPGVYMTPPRGCVGWWDFGAGDSLVWGGKDSAGVDDFADNDSATPATEASYPIVIFGYGMCENPATASQCLLQIGNSDGTESLSVAVSVTGYLRAMSTDGGVSVEADTAAAAIDAQVRFRYIAVFQSSTSRSIYCDQDTTGATNTTSNAPSGIDRVRFFGWRNGTTDWNGNAGPTHVFANATVPSADQRTAFLRDCHDPEVIMGTRATALWMVGDTTSLTDQRGSVNLVVDGDSVADSTHIWALRDQSGQNLALSHKIASAGSVGLPRTTINNHAAGDFGGASSSLASSLTTPFSDGPLQFYAAGNSDTTAGGSARVVLGVSLNATHYCVLQAPGNTASRQRVAQGAAGVADSASDYTVNVDYLLWGYFDSGSGTCGIERNGAAAGSDASSTDVSGMTGVHLGSFRDGSQWLDGQLGLVMILNTSSLAAQPSIERFTSAAYALGF